MTEPVMFDPDLWREHSLADHRRLLAEAVVAEFRGHEAVVSASVKVGPLDRPYDLTASLETDVGSLRSPLWSHARAVVFCDPSIHPENRKRFAPGLAVAATVEHLRPRLEVQSKLGSRGLELNVKPADGIERTWSAEKSLFRGRTAVVREDRIHHAADADLRELLAHHYSGPSLRVVGDEGSVFFLPGMIEGAEGDLIALCVRCQRWEEGAVDRCSACESPMDVRLAVRPPAR